MGHYLPRIVESLVVNQMKDNIISTSTIYQVGGQPGHSTDKHLFSIKSLMELSEVRNFGIIFTLVDLVSFFDWEEIYDVVSYFV